MAAKASAAIVMTNMLWTLLLVAVTAEFALGTMLKCGEDIVVSRGERKTLKFWSAEDDLLKVQVVPADGEKLKGPPTARPVTYSRLPGLSEAILAHSRYSNLYADRPSLQSGAGLHYAGNPDIDINSIFQSDNDTGIDDYEVPADEPVGIIAEPAITKQEMPDMGQSVDNQESASHSRIPEASTTEATTTSATEASTTTPTQSIKLVTFFPDLQNYNPSSSTENDVNKVESPVISGNLDKNSTGEQSESKQTNVLEFNSTEVLSENDIQSATVRNIAENKYQEFPVDENISGGKETEQETTLAPDLDASVVTVTEPDSVSEVSSTELMLDVVEESTQTPEATTTTKTFTEDDTLSLLRDSLSEILQKINVQRDPIEDGSTAPPTNEPTVTMSNGTVDRFDGQNESSQPIATADIPSDISRTESAYESQTEAMSNDDKSDGLDPENTESSKSEMPTTEESVTTVQSMIIPERNSEGGVDEDPDQEVTTAIVGVTTGNDDTQSDDAVQNLKVPPHISVHNIFKEAIQNQLGDYISMVSANVTEESDLEMTTTEETSVGTESTDRAVLQMSPQKEIAVSVGDGDVDSDMLAKEGEDNEATTTTVMSSTVPEGENELNGEVEETTILAQLLRDSLSQIVFDMNKGTNYKQPIDSDGFSLTSKVEEAGPSAILSTNGGIEKMSNDETTGTEEKDNQLNINTDSVDYMEMIMNTFSDQGEETTTEGLSEQSNIEVLLDDPSSGQYLNIKEVNMAGHQNTAESTLTNKVKDQSRMGVDIDYEDSITTEIPATATENYIIDVDYEATKDSIPTNSSVSSLSNSTNDIVQDRVQTDGLDFEKVVDNEGKIQPIFRQNILRTEGVDTNFASTIPEFETVSSLEQVTENTKHREIFDIESTSFASNTLIDENSEVTTEIPVSESPDGFKGYEYYETLYDSLMPQPQKSGINIPVGELFGENRDDLDENSDSVLTTPIPDFDTDMEVVEVDYEATKDSLPESTSKAFEETGDHEVQIRVQTSDLDFEEAQGSNDQQNTTMAPVRIIESGSSIVSLQSMSNKDASDLPDEIDAVTEISSNFDTETVDLTEATVTESESDVTINGDTGSLATEATGMKKFEETTAEISIDEDLQEETTAEITVSAVSSTLEDATTAPISSNYRDNLSESDIGQENFQVHDYEETKDSIPHANANIGETDSLKDIHQVRVINQPSSTEDSLPDQPVDTDNVQGIIIDDDFKGETTAEITATEAFEDATTAPTSSNYRDDLLESDIYQESFQVQDYEATKDSIPQANENTEETDSLKDIYQMRVSNQPSNTEDSQPDLSVDADNVQGTIVAQDVSTFGKEGEESENDSMSNNILNSIASIIRHTMSSSPFGSSDDSTKEATTTTIMPEFTTENTDKDDEQNSNVEGEEEFDNEVLGLDKEDSTDDMIQIPLQIIDGQVKVSHDRNSASITVPMSALETEEALDNYLSTHLQKGSHVFISENGSKVSINSLDELTSAMELEMEKKINATESSHTAEIDPMDSDISPVENHDGSNSEDTLKDALQEAIALIQNGNNGVGNNEETSTDSISELTNIQSALESETPEVTTDSTSTTASEMEPIESHSATAVNGLGQPGETPSGDEEEDLLPDRVTDIPYEVEVENMTDEMGSDVEAGVQTNDNQNSDNYENSNGNPIQNTVIDILEQMLLSEPSPPQNANAGSSERQVVVDEPTTEGFPPPVEYSNDFNMDSIRYYQENRESDNYNTRATQSQERKPARKDDSGHEFGSEPPFFIKLPGSSNSVPLYIQYEPVQVRYVPVESREGSVPLPDEDRVLSPTEFSSRTGLEEEINAIETDVIMNHTMASPTRSPLIDHMENINNQKVNASGSVLVPSEPLHDESSVSDDNEILHKRPVATTAGTRTSESTHAHINIPLDFLSRQNFYNQAPDPFVVMPPPDLTSQEVQQDDKFPDYGVNDYMDERQDNKQRVTSSIEGASEDENKIGEVMLGAGADEPLPPGQYYSSENRGTIYGDVDLDRLNNPVFSLQTEMKRPSQEEMMNPAYTPFPITANPPRIISTTTSMPVSTSTSLPRSSEEATTQFMSKEVITQPSTTDSPSTAEMLVGNVNATMLNNDIFGADLIDKAKAVDSNSASYQEPKSVVYSSIPAVDFRISYNPSDVPKFMKQNPNSFPAWYPQAVHENTFHAAALTASDASKSEALPSMAAVQTPSGDYKSFTQGKSATTQVPLANKKVSARYTGNFHPNEASWQDDDDQHYGAFYHPADIPGVLLSDLTKRHLSLEDESSKATEDELPWYTTRDSTSSSGRLNPSVAHSATGFRNDPTAPLLFGPKFFQYLNSLPAPLLRDFMEPSPSERAVRIKRRAALPGEQIFCEWNIKTEPGLYLLMNFQNLSAPYSVDCKGAYIEVERENNGYDARWCGNRIAHMGTRPHVIFAKSEVRITVYDDGNFGKSQPTGFEADIDVIDLFNPSEYSEFMGSEAYPHIRRLLRGR